MGSIAADGTKLRMSFTKLAWKMKREKILSTVPESMAMINILWFKLKYYNKKNCTIQ